MRTNKIIRTVIFAFASATIFLSCKDSTTTDSESKKDAPEASVKINVGDKPLNISVYLDLSDRIIHGIGGMSQTEKDTAIVNHIADIFYSNAIDKNERKIVDRINVFFYPTPTISDVNQLAKDLKVDLSSTKDKLRALTTMKSKFQTNLGLIYDQAVQSQNFLGSDLWGFFNEQAEVQCVAKGYRNILVILTDGYVYIENNLVAEASGCSYVSAKTLRDGTPLIVGCKGLNDLEVLILETNPNPNTDYPKLKSVLETWLQGMGVDKFRVVKTDIPPTTFQSIDNFFEQ